MFQPRAGVTTEPVAGAPAQTGLSAQTQLRIARAKVESALEAHEADLIAQIADAERKVTEFSSSDTPGLATHYWKHRQTLQGQLIEVRKKRAAHELSGNSDALARLQVAEVGLMRAQAAANESVLEQVSRDDVVEAARARDQSQFHIDEQRRELNNQQAATARRHDRRTQADADVADPEEMPESMKAFLERQAAAQMTQFASAGRAQVVPLWKQRLRASMPAPAAAVPAKPAGADGTQ